MTAGETTEQAAAQPRIPVLVWSLAVVTLIGLLWAGAALIRRGSDEVNVWVAKSPLPAFHRIVGTDLEASDVARDNLPNGGALSKDQLRGRLTRSPIAAGQPIGKSSVTKFVHRKQLNGVRIKLNPLRSSASDIVPGGQVALRLAPTSDDAASGFHAQVTPALLLSTGSQDGPPYTVVVARNRIGRLLDLVGRAELFITPASPPKGLFGSHKGLVKG